MQFPKNIFSVFYSYNVPNKKQIYLILKQQIHSEMKEESEQQKLHIKFNKSALQKNSIYSLHEAQLGEKKAYVKVFNQSNITKYNLDEVLQFNASILNQCFDELSYQQNFLQIQQTHHEQDTFFYATKPYECRLDLFLKKKGPRSEKEALVIFQDILKASFSLIMAGFYHRNLRAQHFVKVDNKWKLQSIVDSAYNLLSFSSPDSEYLYNCKHQPPQAYTRDENKPFSEEQMDEWIVWDLGCILIHLLLGHHHLKSQNILQKFKDQPFSFQKVGAKAVSQKTSSQLKTLLGQMCHYNQQKRITLINLIRNGFFSKQLVSKLPANEQPPVKKIFLPKSGSVSQSLSITSVRSDKKGIASSNQAKVISKQIKELDKREHDISVSKSNKIETVQQFQMKISEIVENQAGQMGSSIVHKQNKLKKESSLQTRPSLHEITDEQYNDIINVFKNYIDKVEILGIGGEKFKEILNIFENKKLAQELINLTLYAVNFYKSMELYRLAKSMNQNKPIFKFQQMKWGSFVETRHYKALKKMVNAKYREQLRQTETLKQNLKKDGNSFVRSKQHLQKFVMKCKPDQVKFDDVKQAYRSILKISYDEVASLYTNKKSNQLASLGMYITFCLAIDKFYLVDEFKKNFDFFFNWSKKRPTDYVSLQEFQKYIDEAPRTILVENSRYIIKRFYQV